MSLYNLVCGFNPSCIIFMPMLGRKQEEYPRFRDCFLSEDLKYIDIYTRVGGGNRKCGFGEDALYQDPNFVETFDDEFDNTYGTYRFSVPDKWKKDFENILEHGPAAASDEYVACVKEFFPKLAKEGIIDKVFRYEADSDDQSKSKEVRKSVRTVDKSKKSNIKCEHCKYWGITCRNERSKHYNTERQYFHRCKQFTWRSDIKFKAD